MSVVGQSLPNLDVRDESVDPPIADMRRTSWHGRKMPGTDVPRHSTPSMRACFSISGNRSGADVVNISTLRSNPGERPNIQSSDTLAQFLDRYIVWRIPECADGLHRGKFEHNNGSRIMLAFEHLYLCASRREFAAELGDERDNRLAILLVLGFVRNRGLNNKIRRHNQRPVSNRRRLSAIQA
jgi:hypothetical protein